MLFKSHEISESLPKNLNTLISSVGLIESVSLTIFYLIWTIVKLITTGRKSLRNVFKFGQECLCNLKTVSLFRHILFRWWDFGPDCDSSTFRRCEQTSYQIDLSEIDADHLKLSSDHFDSRRLQSLKALPVLVCTWRCSHPIRPLPGRDRTFEAGQRHQNPSRWSRLSAGTSTKSKGSLR